LLGESDAAANRSKLSGLLVGQELAATQALWAGREVTVIGAPSLGATYVSALAAVGCAARAVDGADTALAGLRDAYDRLRGQET
jgi:2-dehydro-3-deoxygalactonokinase